VEKLSRIGIDTSKSVFQLHGVNAAEQPVLRRKLRRHQMLRVFGELAPTKIGIEACGAAHYWARELRALGHEVVLLPPQYVTPYVKRGKNDAADAEAICEAMSRPTMRFVAVKTAESQAALMLGGVRERVGRERIRLANTIRGYAAEFGVVAPKGQANIEPLLALVISDDRIPALAREMFGELAKEYAWINAELKRLEIRQMAWHRSNEMSRRLARIPGIGPVTASMLAMKAPDPHAFRSGRQFAAWLGLTPKDHSTAGKQRLGVITRAGDETLRSLLVVGATAVIWQTRRGTARAPQPWLLALLKRKPPKLAAVALANKMARIAWKLMVTGESYDADRALPTAALAA
jgi:transposase